MATAAQNLDSAINSTAANLADIAANPKLSYTVGDRTLSWNEYQLMLSEQLKRLLAVKQNIGGPFIIRSTGRA